MRLIVLGEDPLARAGLAALLGGIPGCEVVAQGGTHTLSGLIKTGEGDVIVWDAGWEPFEFEGEEQWDVVLPVLALVQDDEAAAVAWRQGCRAVLNREMNEERLAAAVQAVAAGLMVIAPSFAPILSTSRPENEQTAIAELTPREREVLALLAEGLTNKAIAQRLSISDHTVKFHVNSILDKLAAQSRTDAVVRASRQGLLAL